MNNLREELKNILTNLTFQTIAFGSDDLTTDIEQRAFDAILDAVIAALPEKRSDVRGFTQNRNDERYSTKRAKGFNEAITDITTILTDAKDGKE